MKEDNIVLSEQDSLLLADMLTRSPRTNERLTQAISEEQKRMADA